MKNSNMKPIEQETDKNGVSMPPPIVLKERFHLIQKLVSDAKMNKKTFTIKGSFPHIRKALENRGWIERLDDESPTKTTGTSQSTDITARDVLCANLPNKMQWQTNEEHLKKCERILASRLLTGHEVDFYWSTRRDGNEWVERVNKHKLVNRFARVPFTCKEGLCLMLQNIHWFNEPGVSEVRFPRCYAINFADQCASFVEDFRLTACVSLLRWFVETVRKGNGATVTSPTGRVPASALHFAMARCNEFLAMKRHIDIDIEFAKIWDAEWQEFLLNFQLLVQGKEKFDSSLNLSELGDPIAVSTALEKVKLFLPQSHLDGILNLWIMKPSNKCRGRDIQIVKNAEDVIKVMNNKLKYVVQKYIERPLLIYNTKFDIRQWFLVTGTYPMTIWMYRECYLRFSSKPFTLDNLHESIHLTNNAVQYKYRTEKFHESLPDDNMWNSITFKAYLRDMGEADKWYRKIYPGMREAIIGTLLASQDGMDRRSNTFELFGADFMIARDFTPWLIEINSCPAMGNTTQVTTTMCPRCFEDIIKVVIDRRDNPHADTGLFDQVYKQDNSKTPPYLGMTLSVKGEKMRARRLTASDNVSTTQMSLARPTLPFHLYGAHVMKFPRIKKNEKKSNDDDNNDEKTKKKKKEVHIIKDRLQKAKKSTSDDGASTSTANTKRRVPDTAPVSLKTTAGTSRAPSTNTAISVDRKRRAKWPTKTPVKSWSATAAHAAGLCDKWAADRGLSATWRQDTVSILQCPRPIHNYVSAILPEIDVNTASSQHLCQNFFTVGLGYKRNCKPILKESILVPINTQPVIDTLKS